MLVNHQGSRSETGGKNYDQGGFLVQKAPQRQCNHVLEKYGKTVYIFKETVLFYFEKVIKHAFHYAELGKHSSPLRCSSARENENGGLLTPTKCVNDKEAQLQTDIVEFKFIVFDIFLPPDERTNPEESVRAAPTCWKPAVTVFSYS